MKNSNEGALVSKLKALYGKKIQKKQLIELSNCKSVSDVTSYLKNHTNYKKILKYIDESTVHRGQLENLLKQQNFDNYKNICYYLDKKNKVIFELIIEEFEILEVLKIILLLQTNNIQSYITNLPGYLISECRIDLLNLANIKTYEDLLKSLKHTQYYKTLNKLKPKNENQKIDYISCEYELFKQFFIRTFQTIEKNLRKSEQNELKKLIKLHIDYLNICRIYRAKIIFNENSKNIMKHIFPFYGILNIQKIESLIESKNSEDFGLKFKNIFHINIDKNSKNILEFFDNENCHIENFMNKLNCKTYKRLIHISNNFSVVFYAFHKLVQIELSNLTYVIEGVRYGMLAKKIQNLYIL